MLLFLFILCTPLSAIQPITIIHSSSSKVILSRRINTDFDILAPKLGNGNSPFIEPFEKDFCLLELIINHDIKGIEDYLLAHKKVNLREVYSIQSYMFSNEKRKSFFDEINIAYNTKFTSYVAFKGYKKEFEVLLNHDPSLGNEVVGEGFEKPYLTIAQHACHIGNSNIVKILIRKQEEASKIVASIGRQWFGQPIIADLSQIIFDYYIEEKIDYFSQGVTIYTKPPPTKFVTRHRHEKTR